LSDSEKVAETLESIGERIRIEFSSKDAARESAIRICREIIRQSANSIRYIHRRETDKAQQLLDSAQTLLTELKQGALGAYTELLNSGLVHDAQKELAEAHITVALITSSTLPSPEELGLNYPAYLNGLGEAVGELRRYILDSLRRNDFSQCEEFLAIMDDIYSLLVTIDFPDAITSGLRRTTDVVRGILEKTRGDLTLALQQKRLDDKLHQL
jgi:translin